MSTNEWHKKEYNSSEHGWDVAAARAAQESQKEKTRQMWAADKYLQRQRYALWCKLHYGWNNIRTMRAGWLALELLGLKPTESLIAAYPGLDK